MSSPERLARGGASILWVAPALTTHAKAKAQIMIVSATTVLQQYVLQQYTSCQTEKTIWQWARDESTLRRAPGGGEAPGRAPLVRGKGGGGVREFELARGPVGGGRPGLA